jgi:tyrosine-protein kinase Etk/Wzc
MEQIPDFMATLHKPEKDDIALIDMAAVLWKRRRIVIGFTVAVTIVTVALLVVSLLLPSDKSFLPNVYKPKAMMLIGNSSSNSLSSALSTSGLGSLAGIAGLSTGGNANGQLAVTLANSNTTFDTLSTKFNLSNRYKIRSNNKTDTRKAIARHMTAAFDTKTNIFSLSYEDRDSVIAQGIVNTTVDILSARFASLGGSKAVVQRDLLESKLVEVKSSIDQLESRVKCFQAKYGVTNVEALATEQITVLARMRSELILKDLAIENYKKISLIDDPMIKRLQDERESIMGKIRELENGQGVSSENRVMPSQKELPTIAFEYAKLQRDMLVQTEVYKLLTQQYELAKLNAAGQEPVFQVLELAEAPDRKSGPSRGMICIVAVFAAFFLAILLAFILESIEKVKADPEAMAKLRSLPVRKE